MRTFGIPMRAPVKVDTNAVALHRYKGNRPNKPGTITWAEHVQASAEHASRYGIGRGPKDIATDGGFTYLELVALLGRPPNTWKPKSIRGRR